jgi:acid phosphatase type 7
MGDIVLSLKALPLIAVCTWAAASYPAIPQDKTTPVQQRLAVKGLNCRLHAKL